VPAVDSEGSSDHTNEPIPGRCADECGAKAPDSEGEEREDRMPKGPNRKRLRLVGVVKSVTPAKGIDDVLWRLDRLERQVHALSELVRDHAEDADRLVRIVAEDREVLRQQLLRAHQARLRGRKRGRPAARLEPAD
jgi:hypothetical protein